MTQTKKATVRPEHNGQRLDSVASELFGITRSAAQTMILCGALTVCGELSRKNRVMKDGEILEYSEPAPVPPDAQPENIPIEIVYEDSSLAVVNKPKGMVVHPAPGNYDGTLVSALLFHMQGRLSSINGIQRPGIVHRIDKDTSGLLIIAKTDAAHIALSSQIKEHSFMRAYEGIVVGNVKDDSGTIDKPVGRNPKDRKKMAITDAAGSRNAVTDYSVIERLPGFCYMRFDLHTGRTHQIRVHMSSIGHPLAGDTVYGAGHTTFEKQYSETLRGQCLHARYIGFVHPVSGEYMEFSSPLPDYFQTVLGNLKKIADDK